MLSDYEAEQAMLEEAISREQQSLNAFQADTEKVDLFLRIAKEVHRFLRANYAHGINLVGFEIIAHNVQLFQIADPDARE